MFAEARENLERNKREFEKTEALGFTNAAGEQVELVADGIDNFSVDENGRIFIGDEEVGGKDVLDYSDPNTASAFKNLQLSPRDAQLAGQRSRDEAGRFTANPEPEQPLYTEPCSCGNCANIREANIIGSAYDPETQETYVRHLCKCGEERLTYSTGLPDSVQEKAIENDEVMEIIYRDYMPREER